MLIFERFRAVHDPLRQAYFDWRLKTFELESEFRFAFGSFGDRDPDGYLARVRDPAGVFWLGDGDLDRIGSLSASAIYFLKPEAHDAYAARVPGLHFEPIRTPFGATVALMASRDPFAWTADSP